MTQQRGIAFPQYQQAFFPLSMAHFFFLKSSALCPVGRALSTDCGCVLHGLFGCVPPLDTFLWLQGAFPPGFNPLWRGWIYRLAPEACLSPRTRGIFGTACHVGLRPCNQTYPKNDLVPHSYAGGA